MNSWLMKLVKSITVIACLSAILWSLSLKEETPKVEEGKSVVIFNGDHYAETSTVYEVNATSEYVFLNHGYVISVFNMNGEYCYSIVTTYRGNGLAELYCSGTILTLLDKNNHAFVYDGALLLRDYQIETIDQYSEFRKAQLAKKNEYVSLSGNNVVDRDGHVIFTVNGPPRPLSQTERWIVLAAFFLVFSLFIVFFVKEHQKRNQHEGG